MNTIYKYHLPWDQTEHVIDMPKDVVELHVAVQHGSLFLWCQVDSEAPKRPMKYYVVGTGHEVPKDACSHIGTVVMYNDYLVLHVYDAYSNHDADADADEEELDDYEDEFDYGD